MKKVREDIEITRDALSNKFECITVRQPTYSYGCFVRNKFYSLFAVQSPLPPTHTHTSHILTKRYATAKIEEP